MGQPSWRKIAEVIVPEGADAFWTPALDYVNPGKLYRIMVEPAPVGLTTRPPVATSERPENVPAEAVATEGTPAESGPVATPETSPAEAEDQVAKEQADAAAIPNADGELEPPPIPPENGAPTMENQRWRPESGDTCTADGNPNLTRSGTLILANCAPGALIGKVGGSTADLKPDQEKVVLFSVGRHCVFSVSDAAKCGSLYLGMNDTSETVAHVQNPLRVAVYEAL